MQNNHKYIAIEGVIGIGKTTLARLLQERFQELFQPEDVPLSVTQAIEALSLGFLGSYFERPEKRAVGGNNPQIGIQDQQRLPHGVNDFRRKIIRLLNPVRGSAKQVTKACGTAIPGTRFFRSCHGDLPWPEPVSSLHRRPAGWKPAQVSACASARRATGRRAVARVRQHAMTDYATTFATVSLDDLLAAMG